MPMKHGNSDGVSCADCYFRRELLCVLQVERVCPTFRAMANSRPVVPAQAQLVPVPALVREDPAGEPFSSGSPEATFSVREASEPRREALVTAAEAASPRPALRAAAARRERMNELVVQVDAHEVGGHRRARRDASAVDRASEVEQRIARIAQRYPRALASC